MATTPIGLIMALWGTFVSALTLASISKLASGEWRELRDVLAALAPGFLVHASTGRPRRRWPWQYQEGG